MRYCICCIGARSVFYIIFRMNDILRVRVTRRDLRYKGCPIAAAIRRTRPDLMSLRTEYFVSLFVWQKGYKGVSFPVYQYYVRPKDAKKAESRGNGKLMGRILGGFDAVLVKRRI